MNFSSVPEDSEALAAHAQAAWEWLVSEHFKPWVWDKVNKVALPLKPPSEKLLSVSTTDARRILAVWTPISEDGRSCLSRVPTKTLHRGAWVDIEVEVFSASMYFRDLLRGGMTHLVAESERIDKVLAAVGDVLEVHGLSTVR
jgi:hypothetical protein